MRALPHPCCYGFVAVRGSPANPAAPICPRKGVAPSLTACALSAINMQHSKKDSPTCLGSLSEHENISISSQKSNFHAIEHCLYEFIHITMSQRERENASELSLLLKNTGDSLPSPSWTISFYFHRFHRASRYFVFQMLWWSFWVSPMENHDFGKRGKQREGNLEVFSSLVEERDGRGFITGQ